MSLDTQIQSLATAVGNAVKQRVLVSEKGAPLGVATLDSKGKVPSAQLPSYVDDVVEYATVAEFPVEGEAGKLYVALDTNRTHRWSGTVYTQITSGAVDSVAGKTGVVTLVKGDVGLGNVDNTADADKVVAAAGKLVTGRTISITGDVTYTSQAFDGSTEVTGVATLADSGVTAGTYSVTTVDAKGRVTGGSNPTTLMGYGITDATPSSHIGAVGDVHGVASTSTAGFMSADDKIKLDGMAAGATSYVHPTTDGSLHVPATGDTNLGKVLTAGATAGTFTWADPAVRSVAGKTGDVLLVVGDVSGAQAAADIGPTDTNYVAVFNAALA